MATNNPASDAAKTSDVPQPTAEQQTIIDQLTQQLQAQADELASTQHELEERRSELTAVKADYFKLRDEKQTLADQLEEKTSELELAEGLIEQQTAQLKSAEVGQALGPVVVTHEKEQYRLLVERFSHNGNLVESASLRQNPDLVRQLVEMGSGLLVKVEAAA